MFKPKVGWVYKTYSRTDTDSYWLMQVVAIIRHSDARYFVCHKVGNGIAEPDGGQLYLFDQHGNSVGDYADMSFFWVGASKTNRKTVFEVERN